MLLGLENHVSQLQVKLDNRQGVTVQQQMEEFLENARPAERGQEGY